VVVTVTPPEQALVSEASSRLEELRSQLQLGQSEVAAKDRELLALKETVLRIAGAVQVLEELLEQPQHPQERHSDQNGSAM